MSETRFCYWCRAFHPADSMRLYSTKPAPRWRCLSSIEAASRSESERDRFGQLQTSYNRQSARQQAMNANLLRLVSSRGG